MYVQARQGDAQWFHFDYAMTSPISAWNELHTPKDEIHVNLYAAHFW